MTIEQGIVERERRRKYTVGRAERSLQRSRYVTDSGIIGSKEFVGEFFEKVKHLLGLQGRRRFKPISGLDGVYSMKRLTAD